MRTPEQKRLARRACVTKWRRSPKGRAWKAAYHRPFKPCEIQGCEGAIIARGLCNMHYLRRQNNGDPLVARRIAKLNDAQKSASRARGLRQWTLQKRGPVALASALSFLGRSV